MRLAADVVTQLSDPQHGAVTTAQLSDVGADRAWVARMVTSGRWQRLHRGVVVTHSGPVSWRTRAWAAVLYAGPGAHLSHESAAHLHGFRREPPRAVTVSIPEHRRIIVPAGVVVHLRSRPAGVGGRPPRTWRGDTVVDLVGRARTDDEAVGWICDAVRAGTHGIEVLDALARQGRSRHADLLRDLLDVVAEGIESPLERRYRRDVERRHELPRAARQVTHRLDGGWIRADVVYSGFGVRVELDGRLAHPGGRTDADTWRDNAVLLEHGDLTLRYRWWHVAVTPCATASQVAAALRAGGWSQNPRPCSPGCLVG